MTANKGNKSSTNTTTINTGNTTICMDSVPKPVTKPTTKPK
ncbi:hypothetical protein [Acinetobacter baumannii]|nr:hypothetical protein [Acinetobacter baumannii]MCZ3092439.1 hypothetical protein [Acinetobacter baumannii]